MQFFIYSRKSIFTGKGNSVENQIDMCKEYLAQKFPAVSDRDFVIYEDEGYSGKTTARPAFQKMLCDIKQKKPDYVVCYRLDRISRSVSDFSNLIESLNQQGITFICIKEEFDTSKPMGKAMMYIASVFAQLERETIAERVRDNMLMLARTGRWLGGTTPTGYLSEKEQEVIIDGKIKTAYYLKIQEEEIQRIKIIYSKFLECKSIYGVSQYLIQQNIRTKTEKFFSPAAIREILQNPVYCIADSIARQYFLDMQADVCFEETACSNHYGLLSYNKRDYTKKNVPRHNKSQWIIAVGKHIGVVPGNQWVVVQSLLEAKKQKTSLQTIPHNNYSLLSGILICKECGSRMFAKTHSQSKGTGIFYYICKRKLQGGKTLCPMQNLPGKRTDAMVYESLLSLFQVNTGMVQALEHIKKDLQMQKCLSPLENLEQQLKNKEEEIERLLYVLSQPNMNTILIQKVNEKISTLHTNISILQEKKKQMIVAFHSKESQYQQSTHIVETLSDFQKFFTSLSLSEKRMLIQLLVQKIEWDGKKLQIFLQH